MMQAAELLAGSEFETVRDFEFSDQEFERLRILVKDHTGITLASNRKDLVYGRLSKRLRSLGLGSFEQYSDALLESNIELEHFVNAMTTNLTAFFREDHHFDYLGNALFPRLLDEYRVNKKIRLWSAGCSSGEEPYSIAIKLLETSPGIAQKDVKILATDLDSRVLGKAQKGVYDGERIEGLSDELKSRWFYKGSGRNASKVKVKKDLLAMITFKKLNLMESWPFKGPMDVIFCRNVLIYFDKATQQRLLDRFADVLVDGGVLFLGHSETMHDRSDRYELIGKTVYRKIR